MRTKLEIKIFNDPNFCDAGGETCGHVNIGSERCGVFTESSGSFVGDHGIGVRLGVLDGRFKKCSKCRRVYIVQRMADKLKFRNACHEIGGGRPYQMIYAIREKLNFGRKYFDSIIAELAKSGDIELHSADTSKMTFLQIENSYLDVMGIPLYSLSWRGK